MRAEFGISRYPCCAFKHIRFLNAVRTRSLLNGNRQQENRNQWRQTARWTDERKPATFAPELRKHNQTLSRKRGHSQGAEEISQVPAFKEKIRRATNSLAGKRRQRATSSDRARILPQMGPCPSTRRLVPSSILWIDHKDAWTPQKNPSKITMSSGKTSLTNSGQPRKLSRKSRLPRKARHARKSQFPGPRFPVKKSRLPPRARPAVYTSVQLWRSTSLPEIRRAPPRTPYPKTKYGSAIPKQSQP
jgi:hypothetical protein